MKKTKAFSKALLVGFLCLMIAGCVTLPKGFLKPDKNILQLRQIETRQYDTKDEEKIIKSVAGVLQDIGFTLDSSETQLGFVAASKRADAKNAAQITTAVACDAVGIAAACFGVPCYTNSLARCDKEQLVKASIIVQPSLDGSRTVVRATFQRVVWNMAGQINKIETISDALTYQKFYDALSKAIFLEAQSI